MKLSYTGSDELEKSSVEADDINVNEKKENKKYGKSNKQLAMK